MKEYKQLITLFHEKYPHFDDGRINYSKAPEALALTALVILEDKILLLKRSKKVGSLKNTWHGIGGYLDNPKQNIQEKILEEIKEELKISEEYIKSTKIFNKITIENSEKIRHLYPILVFLNTKPKIILDREHTEYQRIPFSELKKFSSDSVLIFLREKLGT